MQLSEATLPIKECALSDVVPAVLQQATASSAYRDGKWPSVSLSFSFASSGEHHKKIESLRQMSEKEEWAWMHYCRKPRFSSQILHI